MELDHLIPEALGGVTAEDNLWLACSLCNDSKGCRIAAEDPTTGEAVRLFNPRQQDWHEHFRWSERASVITGLTPAGRATVVGDSGSTAPRWSWPGEPGSPWAGIRPRTDCHAFARRRSLEAAVQRSPCVITWGRWRKSETSR